MSGLASVIGYWAMALGGISVMCALTYGTAYIANIAASKVIDSYGGWKVFQEYVKWHRQNKSAGDGE